MGRRLKGMPSRRESSALKEFRLRCGYAGANPDEVERVCRSARPADWQKTRRPVEPALAFFFAAWKIAQGDYALAEAVAIAMAGEIPPRRKIDYESWRLWGLAVEAKVRRLADAEDDEKEPGLRDVFEKAVSLLRNRANPRRPAAMNTMVFGPLRCAAKSLEMPIPGDVLALVKAANDRAEARTHRTPSPITDAGYYKMERTAAPEFWRRRFEEKFGMPAPADLIGGDRRRPPWQVNSKYDGSFGRKDSLDCMEAVENALRQRLGLPRRGEGWVNESALAKIVQDLYPGLKVQREARLPFLKGQRFDIWIPDLALGIEYHGVQHFFPVDLFGGAEGFAERQALDRLKRRKCAANGVHLIEWHYLEAVTVKAVRDRLREEGFTPGVVKREPAPTAPRSE